MTKRESTEMTVRMAAFTGEPRRINRVSVSADGTVRVYDSVAGHYTTCHALTVEEQARIVRKASKVSAA